MACLLVPAAEAIVVTVVNQAVKAKEKKEEIIFQGTEAEPLKADADAKIPLSRKLTWLSNMLWGGSALLAFEHVWHGEITPWFPFLTATSSSAEMTEMLQEMATSGVMMAALVTIAWGGMVLVSNSIVKRQQNVSTGENEGR